MIALLLAADLLAATPKPAVAASQQLLLEPRLGITNGAAPLCPVSSRRQAALPGMFRPQDGGVAYKLIDLPPGHLCLAGGAGK